MPPVGSAGTNFAATRVIASPLELSKRAHALLAERFPPARVKHKPLSILRQEGRRALEQYLADAAPQLSKPDRDKFVEEVLGEAVGFGPLEELFRDDTAKEVMVLAAAQVIVHKNGGWVPTSVRFRDAGHYRGYLRRLADTGEPLAGGTDGAFDVRLANGFRVVGVVPPEVLDQPPLAVFARGEPPAAVAAPATASGSVGMSGLTRTVPPKPEGGSQVVSFDAVRRGPSASGSGRFDPPPRPAPLPVPPAPVSEFFLPQTMDPHERVRRRVGERIIRKCAEAGVFDLSALPTAELQRVIAAHVAELNATERLNLSNQAVQVLTLEILSGMRR